MKPIVMATQQANAEIMEDKCPTITAAAGMSGNNQPVICIQGNAIDRADTAGCNGKGWREDVSFTLNTIDRPAVVYGIDLQADKGGANYTKDVSPTLCAESHGTPNAVAFLASGKDKTGRLMASGYDKLGAQEMFSGDSTVIEEKPTISLETFHCDTSTEMSPPLKAQDYKDPTVVATFSQDAYDNYTKNEHSPTLRASGGIYGGGSETLVTDKISVNDLTIKEDKQYVVRRLTPTECCRLQGFPDGWGEIDKYDDFTDEQYEFWKEVKETAASVYGKSTGSLTKESILKWYNNLHTDSAEYKMWGNGIALPTALYVMEGIAENAYEDE